MFTPRPGGRHRAGQGGISLVELVMFIIIVGVSVTGILLVMNVVTRNSADPMLRKQALAIAESLLEEIELQPFTYCDPDDANAATATGAFVGANGCSSAANVQGIGPQAGETRYAAPQFDNVGDYHGFSMNPIRDITNSAVAGLGAYTATVAITQAGATFALAADAALRIDVRVQGSAASGTDITLTGYRFRYAPNTLP